MRLSIWLIFYTFTAAHILTVQNLSFTVHLSSFPSSSCSPLSTMCVSEPDFIQFKNKSVLTMYQVQKPHMMYLISWPSSRSHTLLGMPRSLTSWKSTACQGFLSYPLKRNLRTMFQNRPRFFSFTVKANRKTNMAGHTQALGELIRNEVFQHNVWKRSQEGFTTRQVNLGTGCTVTTRFDLQASGWTSAVCWMRAHAPRPTQG